MEALLAQAQTRFLSVYHDPSCTFTWPKEKVVPRSSCTALRWIENPFYGAQLNSNILLRSIWGALYIMSIQGT